MRGVDNMKSLLQNEMVQKVENAINSTYDALPNLKPGRFKTRRVIDQAYHKIFFV